MKTAIYARLGERIRAERKRLGLTQELLAEKAHLSTAFIGQLERGQNVASLMSLDRISRALGLTPADLLAERSASYRAASASEKIMSLLRERPAAEQQYLYDTIKTLVRRLNRIPGRKDK